jgi:hypothetical protein
MTDDLENISLKEFLKIAFDYSEEEADKLVEVCNYIKNAKTGRWLR